MSETDCSIFEVEAPNGTDPMKIYNYFKKSNHL